MKALTIGATGKDLLQILLNSEAFHQVEIFVRKDFPLKHPKLTTRVIDFNQPEQWAYWVSGDVLFSCLGTTLKAAGSQEAQYRIDFTYQYEFAQAARNNGVSCYALVSSLGASPTSRMFYLRMKGELEQAVLRLGFEKTLIFQPPSLIRQHPRASEKLAISVLKVLNALGLFLSQKPLSTQVLARAMANAPRKISEETAFLLRPQIETLAQ